MALSPSHLPILSYLKAHILLPLLDYPVHTQAHTHLRTFALVLPSASDILTATYSIKRVAHFSEGPTTKWSKYPLGKSLSLATCLKYQLFLFTPCPAFLFFLAPTIP